MITAFFFFKLKPLVVEVIAFFLLSKHHPTLPLLALTHLKARLLSLKYLLFSVCFQNTLFTLLLWHLTHVNVFMLL